MPFVCALGEMQSELLQLLQAEKKSKRRTHNVCMASTTVVTHLHGMHKCSTQHLHSIHNLCTHAQPQCTTSTRHAQMQYTHLHSMHNCSTQHLHGIHNLCTHAQLQCTTPAWHAQLQYVWDVLIRLFSKVPHLSRGQGSFKLLPFCFSDFETLLKSQQAKTFILKHILWTSPSCAVRGIQIKTLASRQEKQTLAVLPEDLRSVPSIHIRQFLTASHSSSKGTRRPLVASLSTCTDVAYT